MKTDDDEKPDCEPDNEYLTVFKTKLRELVQILANVYPPAESYCINEKLAEMGRILLFVSNFSTFSLYHKQIEL